MTTNREELNHDTRDTLIDWFAVYNANLSVLEGPDGPVQETAIVFIEHANGEVTLNGGMYENRRFADWASTGYAIFEDYDGRGDPDGCWIITNSIWRWTTADEMTEEQVLDALADVDTFEFTEEVGNALRMAKAWIEGC